MQEHAAKTCARRHTNPAKERIFPERHAVWEALFEAKDERISDCMSLQESAGPGGRTSSSFTLRSAGSPQAGAVWPELRAGKSSSNRLL